MGNYNISDSNREYFFENYEHTIFPGKILLFMIFTFSFYLVYWLYKVNKDFLFLEEKYDVPDPQRAISVLVILPALWFLIMYFVKKFIFHIDNQFLLRVFFDTNVAFFKSGLQILGFIELGVWIILLFLILKYFYDFCVFFGDLTKTNFFIWYIFLCSEVFGFIFLLLGQHGLFFLVFFTLICIPAMQDKLNSLVEKSVIEQQKKNYYHFNRK